VIIELLTAAYSMSAFPQIATDLRTCWEVGLSRAIERFESRRS